MTESAYARYMRKEWELFKNVPTRTQLLLDVAEGLKVRRVVDIGCGAGQEMLPLLENGEVLGVGIDVEPESASIGRILYATQFPQARVCFVTAFAEDLPFDSETFEVVICRIAIAYMNNRAVLKEIARVLQPNGILLLKIIHARYYLREVWRGIKAAEVRKIVYASRVLFAGMVYHVLGNQPAGLANGETFQTRWMLFRELHKSGLRDTGRLVDDDAVTPTFVIRKVEIEAEPPASNHKMHSRFASESRTAAELREHYLIERELADRVRKTNKEGRRHLYTEVYDELYRRVPSHPQLVRKETPAEQSRAVAGRLKMLSRFLRPNSIYLEVGPGDCALALKVSQSVSTVYAVDVSEEITKDIQTPTNFHRLISDGCSIPVNEAVDIAFSDQLIEHLHPEDALEQLKNIHACLRPGGTYFCITPNRLSGPHDISQYFDETATGFHLREYSNSELSDLFRQTGFRDIKIMLGARGRYLLVPVWIVSGIERLLKLLPVKRSRQLARTRLVRPLLGINLVATK